MSYTISYYARNRDNNFNLIRFIAAILVLISHSFPLTGTKGEPFYKYLGISGGTIAVDVFFITSGFLIANSFFMRKSIIAFIWARFLRIYPALFMAILFCVFVIGLFFTTNSTPVYFSNNQTALYFLKNITLFGGVEFNLPGVFSNIIYKNAVNGSLWTLPYEVKSYVYLAVIGTFLSCIQGLFKRKNFVKKCLLIFGFLALILHIINHYYTFISVHSIHLLAMFFMGVAFYSYREEIILSSKYFNILFLLLLISTINKQAFFISYSLFLPYITLYIAYVPKGLIRKFNKFGDYSYGIYIYAFPVQQSISALFPEIFVHKMIIISLFFTFSLSFLSWHLIEKNFLKLKL